MKQFPECMVEGDTVQAYRNFYNVAREAFCDLEGKRKKDYDGMEQKDWNYENPCLIEQRLRNYNRK